MKSSFIRRLSLFTTSHNIAVLEGEGRKAFIVKWARPEAWVMLAFVCGMILLTIIRRHASLAFSVFVGPFSYFTLCLVLNRTIVEIINRKLFVKHRPLPWPGNRAIPIDDIRSVYVERMESSRERQLYNIRII